MPEDVIADVVNGNYNRRKLEEAEKTIRELRELVARVEREGNKTIGDLRDRLQAVEEQLSFQSNWRFALEAELANLGQIGAMKRAQMKVIAAHRKIEEG